ARLLLDTGASGLCLILTVPFVEQHGLASVAPAIEAPIGTGLAGELHGTIVRLQQLELGRLRVTSPTTGLGSENKGFLGRTDIDGVIGNAVFEGSRLIVDYARRRVIIEPRVAGGSLCDYDMSGLRLVARRPAPPGALPGTRRTAPCRRRRTRRTPSPGHASRRARASAASCSRARWSRSSRTRRAPAEPGRRRIAGRP